MLSIFCAQVDKPLATLFSLMERQWVKYSPLLAMDEPAKAKNQG
jgi:hypothetical protein